MRQGIRFNLFHIMQAAGRDGKLIIIVLMKPERLTYGRTGLIHLTEKTAVQRGLTLSSTTDAKYLEVGLSSKSDNVDTILIHFMDSDSILPKECAFWGDEYIGLDQDIFGSDSFMITQLSKEADFFDVSPAQGIRPDKVQVQGGGVDRFLRFLYQLAQ